MPSAWQIFAVEAIKNSITPLNLSLRRRMKSRVQPTMEPLRRTGSQLVTARTVRSASTARTSRTLGSSSSASPPRGETHLRKPLIPDAPVKWG